MTRTNSYKNVYTLLMMSSEIHPERSKNLTEPRLHFQGANYKRSIAGRYDGAESEYIYHQDPRGLAATLETLGRLHHGIRLSTVVSTKSRMHRRTEERTKDLVNKRTGKTNKP